MGGSHSGLVVIVSKQSDLATVADGERGRCGCRCADVEGLRVWLRREDEGCTEGERVVVGNERAKLLGVGQKRVILRNHASSSSSKSSSSSSSPSPSSPSSSSRSSSSSPSSSSSILPR